MITNKEEYLFYLKADKFALGIEESFISKIKSILLPNYIWNFQALLRKTEYYKNCKKSLFGKIIYILLYTRFRRLSVKLGFSIPLNVFGPGLSIAHYGTIVVNSNAKIGSNCRIHIDVNIGASNGSSKAPKIGNNCYIGPGSKIYGDIKIADNVTIGANSVVNKSVNESKIVVAGCPAKKINTNDVKKIVLFSSEAVTKNIIRNNKLGCYEQNKIIEQS